MEETFHRAVHRRVNGFHRTWLRGKKYGVYDLFVMVGEYPRSALLRIKMVSTTLRRKGFWPWLEASANYRGRATTVVLRSVELHDPGPKSESAGKLQALKYKEHRVFSRICNWQTSDVMSPQGSEHRLSVSSIG